MGCRCKDRAAAIRQAAIAVAHGDTKAVAKAASFVRRTMAEDAKAALSQARQAAQARLGMRRR